MASPAVPKLVLCELGETRVPGLESYSPFVVKVHRGLKYLGLPYERRHGLPASFKKHNPTGQVPVLLIGDSEAVADSTDILARIQTLAGRTFHGTSDPRLAAEALLWEELADTSLGSFLMCARFADDRNWPRLRETLFTGFPLLLRGLITHRVRRSVIRRVVARDFWRAGPEACWRRFQDLLDQLEARAPEEGFWLGAFSTADLALFGPLFSLRQDLTPWQKEQISSRSRLSRYLDRVDGATRGAKDPGGARTPPAARS